MITSHSKSMRFSAIWPMVPQSLYTGSLEIQEYLAHKKQRPPGTLQKEDAYGPMVVLGGGG